MRRLLLLALVAALLASLLAPPAQAQECGYSNSVPSYYMCCDWWWNPENVNNGQAQWEYWCYADEAPWGWVRTG
jgi:hypothetical protein